MRPLNLCALALAIVCVLPVGAAAQAGASDPPEAVTPVKVQIVLTRYQGDKKLSSMPFTLSFNVIQSRRAAEGAQGGGHLRMGSKIPIKMSVPLIDGKNPSMPGAIQYQDVGTNLDCRTTALADGRFAVEVTVDDTSVYGEDAGAHADQPSFRSFRSTNSMVLKDGQTGQFTSAVDKVSGEVTKVDVTLTLVK